MGVPSGYGDAGECIRAAKANMHEVKQLLAQPSVEHGEKSAEILREVEIQLGCAAAILKTDGAQQDGQLRSMLTELQGEVATLAQLLSAADNLLCGWLSTIRTKRAGYTERGQAAPLVLVKKVMLEG